MKTLQKYFRSMVFVAGLIIATHSPAGGVLRNFTDTQGRTIKGQLMGFDDHKQLVIINRVDNGKPSQAPLAVFSDTDQQYIQAWNFEHDFRDSLRISISRKTFKKPNADDGKRYPAECIKSIGYEVELENQSTTRFEAVEIEYCLFYHQGEHQRGKLTFIEGVQYGRFRIESISPDSNQCLITEPVLIFNETGPASLFGRSEGARGEVLGLWLRVHITSPSGAVITREHRSPSTLGSTKVWTSKTAVAGLNHKKSEKVTQDIRLSTLTLPSIGRLTIE
jgi:hypothetical protein